MAIPLPWIASELGWVVAEYGRQPWTIANILPTHLSTSSVEPGQLYLSLAGFFVFYTVLADYRDVPDAEIHTPWPQ